MTAFFFILCSLFLSSFVPYTTSSPPPPCPALPAAVYSFAQVYNSSSPEFSTTQKLDWNQALSYSPCAVLSIPSIGALQSLLPLLSSSSAASCPWNVRSGRHSYEGLSSSPNSLVLDVSSLRALSFLSEAQPQQRQQEDRITPKRTASASTIVKVGPGVCMMELYSFLLDHRLIFPGGTCPTVGVHGYVLGGGFGFLSRRMGLGADNLVAAKVVLANGTLVSCSPKERPDLFFALRGGGNGNFGVVVELQLRVWPLPSSPRSLPSGKRKDGGFQHVSLSWGRNETVQVLARWQRWAPFADTRLTSQLNVYEGNVGVIAQWMADDEKELQQELKRLLVGLPQPTEFQVKKMSAAEAIVEYAGCSTVEECLAQCMERPSSETKNRLAWKAKSIFASRFLEDAEIEELVSWMREREKIRPCCKGQFAGFMLDAFGGAIAKVPVKETAFPHRDALFLMQLMGYWNINDNPQAAEDQVATLEWLQGAYATATKLLSPLKAYRNYDDRDLAANYMDAYYGPNARALAVVKQKYDPEDRFSYALSVKPATNNRE